MASRTVVIVLTFTLFFNGYQTLGIDKFVNNIKPSEAYKKFQDVSKTPKQIKEEILPNQTDKKDEFELNKHFDALKDIDEKVKNYQPSQGLPEFPSLISNQEPIDKEIFQDKLKALPQVVQPSNLLKEPIISNSLKEPIGSNSLNLPIGSNPLKEPIGSNPLNLPIGLNPLKEQIGSNPLNLPIGSNPLKEPIGSNPLNLPIGSNPLKDHIGSNPLNLPIGSNSLKDQIGSNPIFKDLNNQLADTLVKKQLSALANQEIGQIFEKLPQIDLQKIFENPQFLQIIIELFNHLQNHEQPLIHPMNKQQGLYHNLFDKQPNHQSLLNNLPFNQQHQSSQDVLKIMERLSTFLPQSIDQPSGWVNGYTGPEFPPSRQNFINKSQKENIVFMLLNNLGMNRDNTIVIPVQI